MKVDFSDQPKLEPLKLVHMRGPLGLHIIILIVATFVWFMEMCMGHPQYRKTQESIVTRIMNMKLK